MIRSLLAAVLPLALASTPALSAAQVNRCTAPDGTPVYTDRDCRTMGAIEQLPPGRVDGPAAARAVGRDCARSVGALVDRLTAALHAGDVNRLAALYHWPDTSSRAGHRLMDRLDHIARQPLLEIVPLREAGTTPPSPAIPASFTGVPRQAPPPALQGPPVALRLHHGSAHAGSTSTVFSIHRHMDCWWIHLP